mgnify:CR=1 FL=1
MENLYGLINQVRYQRQPFCQLKNLKDFVVEDHHFPTRWAKNFLFGAIAGVTLGQGWFFIRPVQGMAIQKLMQAVGERPFSGRTWRLFRHVAPTHALFGGSVVLSYNLVFEFLRHHDEVNLRPMIFDHQLAVTLVGSLASAAIMGGSPKHFATGAIFSFFTIGPILYWMKLQGMRPGAHNRTPGIYYTDECSKDDIERFNHQDQVEQLAYQMGSQPGYGIFSKDARHL